MLYSNTPKQPSCKTASSRKKTTPRSAPPWARPRSSSSACRTAKLATRRWKLCTRSCAPATSSWTRQTSTISPRSGGRRSWGRMAFTMWAWGCRGATSPRGMGPRSHPAEVITRWTSFSHSWRKLRPRMLRDDRVCGRWGPAAAGIMSRWCIMASSRA